MEQRLDKPLDAGSIPAPTTRTPECSKARRQGLQIPVGAFDSLRVCQSMVRVAERLGNGLQSRIRWVRIPSRTPQFVRCKDERTERRQQRVPYVSQTIRFELDHCRGPESPGELNYAITTLLRNYWNDHQESYDIINDIIGALEGAKLEFYRRVAAPYEDKKITQNGDVY